MNFSNNSLANAESMQGRRAPVSCTETILVVDDQACLRGIASIILERCGYRVLTAADGAEAMRMANRHADIDLLLTDLDMPGITGEELAGWFQSNHSEVQTVFMSSNHVRLHSLEPCWVVEKPFIHIDVLINTIREALDHGHATLMNTQAAA